MSVNFKDSTCIEGHGNYNQIINTEEVLAKFKTWLKAPDPSTNHNNARKKNHKSTSQWLLEDDRYITWRQQSNSFMWINGISGCGKTLICSTIIENIRAIIQAQPEAGLAYFYFDISDKAKQTSKSLLSSLVLSLAEKSNNYQSMKQFYEIHDKPHGPTEDELLQLLMELLKCFKQVYIIIDALDECDDYHQLFEEVIKVIHEWELLHLHILVSSRWEQDISVIMNECITTEIFLFAELVSSDIASYVHSAVGKDIRWGQSVQQEVKDALIDGANGMFRWVACQIEELKHCPNQKVLIDTLQCLPKSLETTYDQTLQRIDEQEMPSAKVVLQWLVLGMRPLTQREIAIVLTFDPSSGNFDSSLGLEHNDNIMQLCSSLVIKSGDDTVQLAHASVKEYFIQKPRKIGLAGLESGHASIAHCCLKYLMEQQWKGEDVYRSKFPLLAYSFQHWLDHYELSNKNATLQDVVTEFFQADNDAFNRWTWNYRDASMVAEYYPKASGLHYAAYFGLVEIIKNLIRSNKWFEAFSATVQVAADVGQICIVKLLLDKGADVNAPGGEYGSALCAASFCGHDEIARLLLERGADVNAQGGQYGSALCAASFQGHIETIRFLLEVKADVNAQGGKYDNALCAASFQGHAEIATFLLERGADVNAQGEKHGSALCAASFQGHAEIARLLLERGADVNSQSEEYGSALCAASSEGHVEIVRFLLANGANVNAQGGEYGNALYAASSHGHVEITGLLLDSKADVNANGGEYGNALQAASINCHIEIVRLLLDSGADVSAQDGYYPNVLYGASLWVPLAIVMLLLDHGADVNAHGGEYGNALQAALIQGQTENVRLLLERGADINQHGGYHVSALYDASVRGSTQIIRTLLEHGLVDVNTQGGRYGNALQAALSCGHTETAKFLLDHGADVNAKGGEYGNALQAALFGGHTEIVRLLLDRGAELNIQGGYYANALYGASLRGYPEIVKLLLDHGADVNAQGGRYGNALQAALSSGHVGIVNLLLDYGAYAGKTQKI